MKAQFKYAILQNLGQRAYALAAAVLISLVFSLLSVARVSNEAVFTIGTVLSSLALCGVFVVNVIADVQGVTSIFGTPQGYLNILTPVGAWKILFARLVTFVLADFVSLTVAVAALVSNVMVYDGVLGDVFSMHFSWRGLQTIALVGSGALLGYAHVLMLCVFGASIKSGYFHSTRFGTLLTLICVAVAAWALNLFNFVLAPFGMVDMWSGFFTISLNIHSHLHLALYDTVSLVKLAALFVTSSVLIERRINL
jgi:hypothetical protein